jgi:hypothetical protein
MAGSTSKRRCEAMPTVVDPEIKEQTNNSAAPLYKERELFAAEVEMEKNPPTSVHS